MDKKEAQIRAEIEAKLRKEAAIRSEIEAKLLKELEAKQKTEAWKSLLSKAESGDLQSQFELGDHYLNGTDVEQDNNLALEWYLRAAESGYIEAQKKLYNCYLNGSGVEKDINSAIKWLTVAADAGDASSQNELANRYANGYDVEKDTTKSFHYYSLSAEQNVLNSISNLGGWCYLWGNGVEKNYEKAVHWLEIAYSQNQNDKWTNDAYSAALSNYGWQLEHDNPDESTLQKVFECYEKSAKLGNSYGIANLGHCYQFGIYVEKNLLKADELYIKAKESGLSNSTIDGWIKELEDAVTQLADSGDETYQELLIEWYSDGSHFEKNNDKVIYWMKQSAAHGHAKAQCNLGVKHLSGDCVSEDYVTAVKLLTKAAKQGYAEAQKRLDDWLDRNNYDTLTDYFDYSTIEDVKNIAKQDPAYYPINAFNEDFDVYYSIEKCAENRFTLPVIPTSFYNDEFKEVKMHIPCGVKWQSADNKCRNIVLSFNNDIGKEKAIATINQMITSILLAFPIKKVHLNIIDLDNTLDFVLLSGNIDKQLVTRISDYKGLQDLTNRIDALIDKASTTAGFTTMEEYNVSKQTISFPYELILIANYNGTSFSKFEESLVSYFKNGGKFGTYFFFATNATIETSEDEDKCLLANKECYLNINVDNINNIVDENSNSDYGICTLSFIHNPAWQERTFDYINSAVNKKASHTMDWNTLINMSYPDMDSDIDVPIGFTEDGRNLNFRMGIANSHYHAFVIGATGSGKSRFLHDIILSMTIKYKPEDLELYLMDFKGVEFNDYKDFKHVRTVLVNRADEQITYEVIKDLKSVMEERERVLRNAGASDVAEYNRNKLGEHLSQIILIADECQTLFADRAKNGTLQNEIVDIIALIAQQGRAYGVHLLLATQSLANAPQLGKEILNQLSDYFILPCLPEDAARLVPDYARQETEQIVSKMEKGKGQCYYRGPGENSLFTFNYVSKGDMQSSLVRSAIEKAESHTSNGQIYFSGSLQYDLDSNVLDSLLNKKGRSILASPGQEIGLSQKPIMIPLKEDLSENILLLGINDEHFVSRTTMNILASLILTNAKKEYGYKFVVFDCLADDEADYFYLLEDLSNNGLCLIVENRKRISVLKQLCDDISYNQAQPTILVILGQERFRDLKLNVEIQKETIPDQNDISGTLNLIRRTALNASGSNQKTPEIKNTFDAMAYILEQGPESNVHTIMQLDKVNNFLFMDYVGKNDIYKRFKHLVLLRSEADTSVKLSLADDIHLDRMEKNPDRLRAYYYNEESDKYQLFIPFTLPTIDKINNLIK